MEKQIITFSANEQRLIKTGGIECYASNIVSYIEAHFALGANWSGYDSVRAVWSNDNNMTVISTVLDSNGVCVVPFEVLKTKGIVKVNLVGSISVSDVLTDRLTTFPCEAVKVTAKAKTDGSETQPITPSQFEQFVAAVISEVEKVTGMTAQAETLPAGSQATARYENGILYLGIPQGIQGERGETGADGNGIASVVYNADYTLTLVFDNGERFTTPPIRGERGPAGADGRDGRDGADGVTPSLSVGTVTTLPSTEDAYVTRTGTDENPVFNFGIPQGPKGDPGDVSQAQLDAAVSDLKSDLDDLYIPSKNLYNPATDRHGKNVDTSGNIVDDPTRKISDFIFVGQNNQIAVTPKPSTGNNGVIRIAFFTENSDTSFSRALYTSANSFVFTLAPTEKYVVLCMYETSEAFMVNSGSTLLPYTAYGSVQSGSSMNKILEPFDADIADINSKFKSINLFDKSNIAENSYIIPSTGGISSGSGFFASDYIDVSNYQTIKVSKTHLFALYKSDKTYLSAPSNTNSINADLTVDVSEASYIRFSSYNQYLDSAQVGESISSSMYIPYGKYTMPDLFEEQKQIVVDASGNGDYTSFTKAVYDNVDSGVDIIVKAGTYNIVSEYIALFGQSAVDNMADADNSIFNGFQYGVVLRNRKVEFASGAHLVCDWTGHTVDGTHRFSALAVGHDVEILGLDLISTHTFYAIHDDYGVSNPYTVRYENCRVKGVNLTNANCIGGGCKPYSRHIINNCYFDNGISDVVVRYHNTNAVGAEPELYISNSYFNSILSFNYYGSQTTKMKAYVNNCKATTIRKAQESSSFSVDNVELYKWCCEETQ